MPELPETASRAKEIKQYLVGKSISEVEVLQPKCLNIPVDEFREMTRNATITDATHRGKWIQVKLTTGWLLLNLGMGGDIILTDRDHMPDKYVFVANFTDGTCLTIRFWWFGYIHFCLADELVNHKMTAKLGPNVLEIPEEAFFTLVRSQKGKLKAFLLDQAKVAGIGNAYIHDILFLAKLHPNRLIQSLDDGEIKALFSAIHRGLEPSLEKNGAFYEKDIFGNQGGFAMEDIIIGYREGSPCPDCSTPILKIKTGSTSSFICPTCQKED